VDTKRTPGEALYEKHQPGSACDITLSEDQIPGFVIAQMFGYAANRRSTHIG